MSPKFFSRLLNTKNSGSNPISEKPNPVLEAFFHLSPARRGVLYVLIGVAIISLFLLLHMIGDKYFISIPGRGGQLTEGIIGAPRFINPILAVSDSDRDLTKLVFSGLLRSSGETFIPDLAESYAVSADGTRYDITLKNNLVWHDGTPLTAEDVLFTIGIVGDPALKSPLSDDWQGVTATSTDKTHLSITLKSAYAPFIKNLTLGILPKHIWKDVPAEEMIFNPKNLDAVGSGPYKIANVDRSRSGTPDSITLVPFSKSSRGEAYIEKIIMKVETNEDTLLQALSKGAIDSAAGISGEKITSLKLPNGSVHTATLPRTFAVFFNQNENAALADPQVRKALDTAVDKNALVSSVLAGFGEPLSGPLPGIDIDFATGTAVDHTAVAKDILTKAGWTNSINGVLSKKVKKGKDTVTTSLSFTLTTGDSPELVATAKRLKEIWEQIGAKVEISTFEKSDLGQTAIRARKYDALLYGEYLGTMPDPFFFWHSKERADPGLNIALYADKEADALLEKLRTAQEGRDELYQKFSAQIKSDTPAVFLYAPKLVYVLPPTVKGIDLGVVATPAERFADVEKWYMYDDKIWPLFKK